MKEKDCIVSIPVTLVPFLQNNDGTRMQMASNQMRQSLDIYHSEHPLVETGLERFFLHHSDLCVLSNYDGIVLEVHDNFIIVKLDKAEYGICDLKVIPCDKYDYKLFVVPGQRIRKGDILGKVPRFNNPTFKSILNGTNLVTAINSWYGYNYEDAIVTSESCFEKLSHQEKVVEMISFNSKQVPLSLVEGEYEPFLKPGDEVKIGDMLCMIKNSDLSNINELISLPIEKRSSCNGIVEKVDIYINNYHDSTRELSFFLNQKYNNNVKRLSDIFRNMMKVYNSTSDTKLTDELSLPEHIINEIQYLTGFTDRSKWKYKNVEVNVLVKYTIVRKSEFNVGDKLANRHGNKGIGPIIVPDKNMFQINGKPVDVIINLMGIPGRMNLGQVYEMWASNTVNKVKKMAKALVASNRSEHAVEFIKDFYRTIDKTDSKYIFRSINYGNDPMHLVNGLSFIAPPFESPDIYQMKTILEKYKVPTLFEVHDPIGNCNLKMPVGYMFWEKLHHLSEEKISARSVGGYNKKTMQPLSGKKMKGGQKFGEMEVWALLSHDAELLLKETLGIKSDDMDAKNKILQNILDMGKANYIKGANKSSETFMTYLNSIGLDFVDAE